jgi:hypothetical protein
MKKMFGRMKQRLSRFGLRAGRNVGWVGCVNFILNVVHNLKMETKDEKESDDNGADEPVQIMKVEEEYEVKNGLLGLKRDLILKLTVLMNREDDLKNLFGMCYKMSIIKDM